MERYTDNDWQPTRVLRIGESEETSTGVTHVQTDAGWAYCKPIGNRQGEQVLACEWVCVRLARWLGLPTFKAAIIDLDEEMTFELPEHKGNRYTAKAGPCFVTQSTPGRQWSRDPADLDVLTNPEDITGLVMFDTWVRNRDRHHPDPTIRKPNYGNVYLAEVEGDAKRLRLVAMDHTHCFDNGQIHQRLSQIDAVKDDLVYGLFPAFAPHVRPITAAAVAEKLKTVERGDIASMIGEVPAEWQVDAASAKAWTELIVQRAAFVAQELPGKLAA